MLLRRLWVSINSKGKGVQYDNEKNECVEYWTHYYQIQHAFELVLTIFRRRSNINLAPDESFIQLDVEWFSFLKCLVDD